MNGIDDEFIEEALTYERSKKRKPSCVLRIVLVAALISVLLFTSAVAARARWQTARVPCQI